MTTAPTLDIPSSSHGIKELNRLLTYTPATGAFVWKVAHNGEAAGAVATHKPKGSGGLVISILGKRIKAEVVAIAMTTNAWPRRSIRHLDRNPTNNAIANLQVL